MNITFRRTVVVLFFFLLSVAAAFPATTNISGQSTTERIMVMVKTVIPAPVPTNWTITQRKEPAFGPPQQKGIVVNAPCNVEMRDANGDCVEIF